MRRSKTLFIGVLILASLFYGTQGVHPQNTSDPIVPSSPTDVVIHEESTYDRAIGTNRPIMHLDGVVYWEQLAGTMLNFFVNTSDVITDQFWDYQTNAQFKVYGQNEYGCVDLNSDTPLSQNCVKKLSDRYIVVPSGRSFSYTIKAYYDPDVIEDTGFIVIFNSQSVDFSLTVDANPVYARVDYTNKITLPWNAGIVSYAPIDYDNTGAQINPILSKEVGSQGERYSLYWEYKHRQMDSKHDPLVIEVTYSFDPIFLKFTDQVYQNQQQNQQQQAELNRLNILNTSFTVIATLAVIASLFSIMLAYLIAKRKYNSDLQKAKELPRRAVQDIEKADSLQIPTKSLILTAFIIIPFLFHPVGTQAQLDSNLVNWHGVYDLSRDNTLVESVNIHLPILKNVVYIYTNVSQVISISVHTSTGTELTPIKDSNRYIVNNPTLDFNYQIKRPYKLYNNSDMLVYLDRVWLEFHNPQGTQTDEFFHVNMVYTVLLPKGAFLYSASPTKSLDPSIQFSAYVNNDGRYNITFADTNRQMDAFHDVFETQITFSYIGILDALDNLNSNFNVARAKTQDIQSYLKVARSEILLFSILGLIAPLISFFIAYWVFRNRYKKKIQEYEQQQEEQIFVEAPHISALAYATEKLNQSNYRESYIGHYWRMMNKLSELVKKDLSIFPEEMIMEELNHKNIMYDKLQFSELMVLAKNVMQSEDVVDFGNLYDYAKQVEEFLQSIKNK